MAPQTRPPHAAGQVELDPDVRAGVEELRRGPGGVYLARTAEQEAELLARFGAHQPDVFILSPEESERCLETGEMPERVERWLDSYEPHDAS